MSRDEGHNGNLCKTSVVKLARSLPLHGLFANTGEVNGREDHGGERSTFGVVNRLGFCDHLCDEDGGENLCLPGNWNGSPCIGRAHGGEGFEANITREHAGEVNSGGIDQVPGGGNHGHAAVLKLSGTEPEESLIASEGGEVEGVEVTEGKGGAANVVETEGHLGAHRLATMTEKSKLNIIEVRVNILANTHS